MKILTIIPARMSSSRFPGKPLKKIIKKPMIFHVYKRAEMYFKKMIYTLPLVIKKYMTTQNL